tara:strand:+ start:178 stop:1530 length:1353 start_codon:yes stop_codon:yes gene_type:complete
MKLWLLLLLFPFILIGQQIKGTVLDAENNAPLADVSIYLKKNNKGTVSNKNGEFNLQIAEKINEEAIFQFSYLGYTTKEYSFSELKATNYIVYLQKKLELLNEVEVTSNKILQSKINFKKLPSLEKGIYSFGTVLVEDKIYVIGGDASYIEDTGKKALLEAQNFPDPTFEEYMKRLTTNPTWENYSSDLHIFDLKNNSWKTSDLKFRRRAYQTIQYHNNNLYILGGKMLSKTKNTEYLDDKIEIFDLKDNSLKIDNTNPHQAVNAESFYYDNKIIIMGGSTKRRKSGNKIYTNKSHVYDLASGYWYELTDMPEAKEVRGVLVNNTIYLFGGFNGIPLKTIETYTLSTGKWNTEGALFEGIENPALTYHNTNIYLFNNGKIFTYNIQTKVLDEYEIDIDLKASELYYYNDKLYLLGGYYENDYSKTASPNFYSIDITEFSKTKIKRSKKNK